MRESYDVAVVGGGPAGLSGALTLARARRSVLVIDAGQPRNRAAAHAHNFLSRDGVPPAELIGAGRDEVRAYGGEIVDGEATAIVASGEQFIVTLADGRTTHARRVLLTTGLVDRLPDVPGLAAHWGRQVLHCPYCHGWEVRDQRIGVLATGLLGIAHALLWRQWSEQVFFLAHESGPLDATDAERLAAVRVTVVDGLVTQVLADGDRLTGVRLADGDEVELDALAVAPHAEVGGDLIAALGLKPVDAVIQGEMVGRRLEVDETGATGVPGVWAAGNVADVRAHLIGSAASGVAAGAAVNLDLIMADAQAATTAYREHRAEMFTESAWDERYREQPSIWSGRPNAQLVAEASGLTPGRALDVGAGEGADAIWLAERGWRVDALDISAVALERGAKAAAAAGVDIAARIEWIHADLLATPPAEGAYDLVSAHFLQLTPDERRDVIGRLAAAVASGGTLLIVGHHPSMLRSGAHRMHFPDRMYAAEEIARLLDPADWTVRAVDRRPRTITGKDGTEAVIADAVLVATRR